MIKIMGFLRLIGGFSGEILTMSRKGSQLCHLCRLTFVFNRYIFKNKDNKLGKYVPRGRRI